MQVRKIRMPAQECYLELCRDWAADSGFQTFFAEDSDTFGGCLCPMAGMRMKRRMPAWKVGYLYMNI